MDEQTDTVYCTIFWTNETQQELGFGSILFWIFSSYQVKIQQYVGTRMQLPELAWVCQNPTVCWYQVWKGCSQQDQDLQDRNGSDSVKGNCIWPEGGDGVLTNEIVAKWAC